MCCSRVACGKRELPQQAKGWACLNYGVQVLVDVGAGMGYFSLAAAVRGHSVIAFELATRSLVSFAASMQHNNLSHAITLRQVSCGCKLGSLGCACRLHTCPGTCSLALNE